MHSMISFCTNQNHWKMTPHAMCYMAGAADTSKLVAVHPFSTSAFKDKLKSMPWLENAGTEPAALMHSLGQAVFPT